MSLSPQFLDELRARTLLSTLIGKSLKLQRAGREWKACCPFHNEKSPSFYVNDDKGFYHCFGCGAHGDAIRWMTDQNGLSFIEAVKELAATSGLDMPAPDPRAAERQERSNGLYDVMAAAQEWFVAQLQGIEGAEARAYLERRGISAKTATDFGIGFAPDSRGKLKTALATFGESKLIETGLLILVEEKEPYDRFRGRLMIPIRDPRGRVIAFGGRILGAGEPKYLNSPDTPLFDKGRTLYNLDRAAGPSRKADRLIVVEGYMDAIALAQAGIEEVVAPLGTALTEHQLERLWRLVDVPTLCFDGDAAGRKAAMRAALRALPQLEFGKSLSLATLPVGQDPDDLIKNEGRSAFEKIVSRASSLVNFIWQTELESARFDTPENRSVFGKILRQHARNVVDEDIRSFYLADFNQRLDTLFKNVDPRENRTANATGRQRPGKRIPELMRAIFEHGISKVSFAPAILAGLLRYPDLIGENAELVAQYHAMFTRLDFRQICQAMLEAALVEHPLEYERLNAILDAEGLAPALQRLEGRRPLAFSFVQKNADGTKARSDLAKVLELLADEPAINCAIDEATNRVKREDEDANAAFAELQRLWQVKRELNERLSEAMSADLVV
jgi:DNA primase